MARRTRRSGSYRDRAEAVDFAGASSLADASLLPRVLPQSVDLFRPETDFLWTQPLAPMRPAASWIAQEPRSPVSAPPSKGLSVASLLRPYFKSSQDPVCVRRKVRREVIFARTGGGGGMPPRRRTEESNYRC